MLLRYTVSNFLSFNKPTEFNLFTGDIRRFENHVKKHKGIDILKFSAIYGSNASGKSNLVHAIRYLRESLKTGRIIKFERAKFKSKKSKSSNFEIEFLADSKIYIYGIEVFKNKILNEYLYKSINKNNDKLIFERKVIDGKSKIKVEKGASNTSTNKVLIKHYEDKIEATELFLYVVEELELGKLSKEASIAYEWILRTQIIFPDSKPRYLISELINKPTFKKFSKDMLCSFDTGIKDLHIKTYPLKEYFGEDDKKTVNEIIDELNEDDVDDVPVDFDMIAIKENDKIVIKKLLIEHKGFGIDNLFELDEESDGTQRLIEFMIMLYSLIVSEDKTNVFIIDEIGRSIHPYLLKKFLHKLSIENDIKGQLIFTTHESNLLDLSMFRPDEIWFAEKNKNTGSTEFNTLSSFKKIRSDLDIRRGYLNGRFGGIPVLANFEDLNWTEYATN